MLFAYKYFYNTSHYNVSEYTILFHFFFQVSKVQEEICLDKVVIEY